jgi:hypothetical protein
MGIGDINIDITIPNYGISPEYIYMEGYAQPDQFTPILAQRNGLLYVSVAWKDTSLWSGSVDFEDGRWGLMGNADVMNWETEYNFATNFQYLLNPGNISEELESISYGLPGIRKVVFKPDWSELDLPDEFLWGEDNTLEENIVAKHNLESLGCLGTTIGPTAPPSYNSLQFNQMMQNYVAQSVTLGWLKDNALTMQLNNYLTQVAAALNENRLMDAQSTVTQFMNAVKNSTLSQRTDEAYALLYFNAKYFFQQIQAELPVIVEISPSKGEHFLNEEHSTQVKITQGNLPIEGYCLPPAKVISGPNTGLVWRGCTDTDGKWSFSYKSEVLGTDIIIFAIELAEAVSSDAILWQPSKISQSAPITVIWKGGPDLMLDKFFPPMIKIPFAKPAIPLEESTINVGNSPVPASVTRYYITKNKQMSPDDIVIGERQVPALGVKKISEYKADIPVPSNLEEGLYYIYGCADADKQIIELSETNNCRTLTVQVYFPVQSTNRPPDCSQAKADPDILWPPNHKYQNINIAGVADPDGDPVTINVDYIKQDETVNGLGDGDTSPDAVINPLQVRSERSGNGNGRVYQIGFSAQDGKGGKCESVVKVCVPHDQGQGKVCVDDGPQYDSTKP